MIRLSRFAFYGMLLVVAIGVAVYLPEPGAVGRTPSAAWITFSPDRAATEIRRDLKRAHDAEVRAHRRRSAGAPDAVKDDRLALEHYRRAARRLRRHGSRRGYLHRMIQRRRDRIRHRADGDTTAGD